MKMEFMMNTMTFLTPALLLRRKTIIEKLKKSGAVSEENAVTLEEAGVPYSKAFPKITDYLAERNILAKTVNGKYYLKKADAR
ncbi:MAG: hypothetical protein K2K57_08880 [Oscillospiraceae bacterium]|nr:hypothetical protein [Oscillospiraceae bacterium]